MPIAASTDSSARIAMVRSPWRDPGVTLDQLGAGLRDRERVAKLVRHEAGEARQPAALVLLLADVPQQKHGPAARNRRALDVDEHVASRHRDPDAGAAGATARTAPRPAAIRRGRAASHARHEARSTDPTRPVSARRSCARRGASQPDCRSSRAWCRRTRSAVPGSPRPPPRGVLAHAPPGRARGPAPRASVRRPRAPRRRPLLGVAAGGERIGGGLARHVDAPHEVHDGRRSDDEGDEPHQSLRVHQVASGRLPEEHQHERERPGEIGRQRPPGRRAPGRRAPRPAGR